MSSFAARFALDPSVVYLNHGSFGACTLATLEAQSRVRLELEREPVRFLDDELYPRLARARAALGSFVGANPDDLVFVTNATTGVNTALAAQPASPGAEWLVTDQEYNACRNAITFHAARVGATLRVVALPFPVADADELRTRLLDALTPNTTLLLLDHATSPTALILPVAEVTKRAQELGASVIIDGAHAPGMIPLALDELGADFYTGNLHKWLCAPKGAAFLRVAPAWRQRLHPLVISHGYNAPPALGERFRAEFDWMGTCDPSPWLILPEVIDELAAFLPGGWPALMRRNHELAIAARKLILEALEIPNPCPESLLGSMAALPLPDDPTAPLDNPIARDPVQAELWSRFRIEIPVMRWPGAPKRLLRLSAQLYNELPHYEALAHALRTLRQEGKF